MRLRVRPDTCIFNARRSRVKGRRGGWFFAQERRNDHDSRCNGHGADLIAYSPRVSASATVAAPLEEYASATVELHHAHGSLKHVIEQNFTVDSMPELFCSGLLGQFDLLQITALVAPRPVTIIDAEQRVRSEMEPLQDWYARLGSEHVPLP